MSSSSSSSNIRSNVRCGCGIPAVQRTSSSDAKKPLDFTTENLNLHLKKLTYWRRFSNSSIPYSQHIPQHRAILGDSGLVSESWALISKNQGEDGFLKSLLPVFDRSLIKYPVELDSVFLEKIKEMPMASPSSPIPTNRVRATYDFTQSEIKKLKNLVRERIPGLVHVSSFVVVAAYVWNCLAKSLMASETEEVAVEDDEPEFFSFAVDARARIDPPVPGNYFGNCLGFGLSKIGHKELVGKDGFLMAAEAISVEVKNGVINNGDIFGGAENWRAKKENRISISGSARLDLYSADFGWGRARKIESLSIDGRRYQISLCKSRDCEGGLEVGLSLSKVVMDAFAAPFYDGGIRENKCGVVVSRL